ncbi:MAG: phosphoglucosamine mutase [Gammaproteobacteria bacterium]|nr:phosphoglucosamine mutase [Gammaproteobacteria bacterium]
MATQHYFGTDGIRGKVGDSLINPMFVIKLGWAIGKILGKETRGKVLIGKDTRISGYMLESALEAGLSAAGMDIHLLGPMPTPAIAYLTRTLRACAGIVISASHNGYEDNGLKFFSPEGYKLPDELQLEIEAQIEKPMQTIESVKLGKAVRVVDAPGRYIEFCKSTVPSRVNFNGLKIVVDCANGATYHVAPAVFRELGAEVVEISTSPDGLNINAQCGSTHPTFLQHAVREAGAHLGIAFDGDGDRVIMVDEKGEIVDGDQLLFIIARHLQGINKLHGGIVGTSMTNLGFEEGLAALNIPFERAPVGDRNVMSLLKQKNWQLGGESSGHIVHLALSTTGDGIISALQVLCAIIESGRSLTDLKNGMQKYPQVLLNVPTPATFDLNNSLIQDALRHTENQLGNNGRVLLRASGTEPVIRVMVEGRNPDEVQQLAQILARTISDQ